MLPPRAAPVSVTVAEGCPLAVPRDTNRPVIALRDRFELTRYVPSPMLVTEAVLPDTNRPDEALRATERPLATATPLVTVIHSIYTLLEPR